MLIAYLKIKEKNERMKKIFLVTVLLIVISASLSAEATEKKGTHITKVDSIGCKNINGLNDAYNAYIKGGFQAFLPYTKSHGCLFLRKNSEVTKLKTDMPHIQILYHNYYGRDRILWVGYDTI